VRNLSPDVPILGVLRGFYPEHEKLAKRTQTVFLFGRFFCFSLLLGSLASGVFKRNNIAIGQTYIIEKGQSDKIYAKNGSGVKILIKWL
jgi:hypothetical protein